jgi:hypothetical protein
MSLYRYLEKVSLCLCRNNGMLIPEIKSSLLVSFLVSHLTRAVVIPDACSIYFSDHNVDGSVPVHISQGDSMIL